MRQQHQPCQHCPGSVKLNGRGLWIHVNGGYECRDADGVTRSSFTEPVGWPMNAAALSAGKGTGR
jgi:hypothetical protein